MDVELCFSNPIPEQAQEVLAQPLLERLRVLAVGKTPLEIVYVDSGEWLAKFLAKNLNIPASYLQIDPIFGSRKEAPVIGALCGINDFVSIDEAVLKSYALGPAEVHECIQNARLTSMQKAAKTKQDRRILSTLIAGRKVLLVDALMACPLKIGVATETIKLFEPERIVPVAYFVVARGLIGLSGPLSTAITLKTFRSEAEVRRTCNELETMNAVDLRATFD